VLHALQRIDDLTDDLDMLGENPANRTDLLKAARELRTYIEADVAFIPNYGDRYRHHEMISTAFVESTVNYVGPIYILNFIDDPQLCSLKSEFKIYLGGLRYG